jgi:hypothetical protein
MQAIWKKLTRWFVMASVFFLPREKKIAVERRVRGREQFQKLRRADAAIASFGKSGRTWLRVMMSRFYQVRHGLPERALIGFDNLHRKNRAIPKLFFTHDNYLKDYTGHADSKVDYAGLPVILLARHPADVAVSQFHQWRHRMKRRKMEINRYPDAAEDLPLFDFVARHPAGLTKAIEFLNGWAPELEGKSDRLLVRYEDLKSDPEATLGRILEFLGTPGTPDEIAEAVRFASFDNMRQMEERRTFWLSGGRMVPKDRKNKASYKTRRGQAGGYRGDFDAAQLAEIETVIREKLAPVFGYSEAPDTEDAAQGGSQS